LRRLAKRRCPVSKRFIPQDHRGGTTGSPGRVLKLTTISGQGPSLPSTLKLKANQGLSISGRTGRSTTIPQNHALGEGKGLKPRVYIKRENIEPPWQTPLFLTTEPLVRGSFCLPIESSGYTQFLRFLNFLKRLVLGEGRGKSTAVF